MLLNCRSFLFNIARGYKLYIFFIIFILNMFAIQNILAPYLTEKLLESFELFYKIKEFYILVLMVCFMTLHHIFSLIYTSNVIPLFQKRIRLFLYEKFLYTDKPEFAYNHINIISMQGTMFFTMLESSITAIITCLLLLISLFRVNFYLFLMSLIYLGVSYIFFYLKIHINQKQELEQEDITSKVMQDTLNNNHIVKNFNCKNFILKKIITECEKSENVIKIKKKNEGYIDFTSRFIYYCTSNLFGICLLSYAIFFKWISPVSGILIYSYFQKFLAWNWWTFESSKLLLTSYRTISQTLKNIDETPKKIYKIPSSFQGLLEIKNLTFNFQDKFIFKNVNLTIKPGDRWCITGKSGTGKSTLLRLLSKQIEPPVNTIFLDGQDIIDIDPDWYKEKVGFIFQANIFYEDTVVNNILLGRNISQKHMDFCAKKIKAYDFIQEKDNKYEEIIKDNNFSGGQMQRLSILRAIVGNPSIIFGDEPSSALDANTEEEVFNNLLSFAEEKKQTVILITHNKSLMNHFTNVLDLGDLNNQN